MKPLVSTYDYATLMHMGIPSVGLVVKKIIGKKLQAGHFQSRKHYSTRWNETNVQVQCVGCNVYRYGEQYKFGSLLDIKYGKGTADKLYQKAKGVVKLSTQDLEFLIKYYKEKVAELEKRY